jgi:hypothetical protein
MPVITLDLIQKIRTRLEDGWSQIGSRSNTSYYMEMTQAVGTGISDSINSAGFTTEDNGLSGIPFRSGKGIGYGIFVDREILTREIYSRIRQKSQTFAQSIGGDTGHPVYNRPYIIPENYELEYSPPDNNALFIFAKGIAESVYECFSTQIILNSNHPMIYFGEGEVVSFTAIDASIISGRIFSNSSTLLGAMWPKICDAIGEAVDYTLQNHTTGEVLITGICVPSGSQSCGIPLYGVGTGTIG